MPTGVYEHKKGRGGGKGKAGKYKRTKETLEKFRLAKLGDKNPMFGKRLSPEARQRQIEAMKKKVFSEEHKRKLRLTVKKGKDSNFWRGGIATINNIVRHSLEYRLWRTAVFERDNYTCIWCGQRGGRLNADHIKPFAFYPELRFAIDNGRTLCERCHKTTETWGKHESK